MISTRSLVLFVLALIWPLAAKAEVQTAAPDHLKIVLQTQIEAAPERIWSTLVSPDAWWSSDHTYSGDAANLSLSPIAGGLWRESWAGGSVWHGSVLHALPHKTLRLQAPFGPLQGISLNVIWTVTLTPGETDTIVIFEIVAHASPAAGLDQLADPVEGVFKEALENLRLAVLRRNAQ